MANSPPLPVFHQPAELKFVISDPATHKQVLTIYNPYEFKLHYVVLSNVSAKFRVSNPRGMIGPKCYVDIMVRHLSPTIMPPGCNESMRIEIMRDGCNKVIGRKDVPICVSTSGSNNSTEDDEFHAFPSSSILKSNNTKKSSQNVYFAGSPPNPAPNSTMLTGFMISSLVICLSVLLLPTDPNSCSLNSGQSSSFSLESLIPPQMRPSVTVKLVSSFVIGLITYALFQQNH